MCKVLFIAGIQPKNVGKVQKLAKAAAKVLSKFDSDGVGYAAITSKGNIYGEKWLNKEQAFTLHAQPVKPPPDKLTIFMNTMFGDMVEPKEPVVLDRVYDSFGVRNQETVNDTVAMILHTRNQTVGSKTIENVHPFHVLDDQIHSDTALIHNGGIVNHWKLTKKTSSCDSETILHEYLKNFVYHNPNGIEEVAKTLIGEYAVGVLSSMYIGDKVIPILDVFKSGKELHVGWVPEIQTFVFCTTESGLEESVKEAGMNVNHIMSIKDGFMLRIDAISGSRADNLVKFNLSAKFDNMNHHYDNFRSSVKAWGEGNKEVKDVTPEKIGISATSDDSIQTAKNHFEKRHPSLFSMPYLEVNGPLTTEERDYYAELDKNPATNHVALHLVALALSAKSGT